MVQRLQISSYDPRWVLEFEAERDRLVRALGALACRIDHNGSTAVPGLEAKPIIDIQVSVQQLQPLHVYAEPLATLGYVHVPHADDAVCPFFHRPREWPRASSSTAWFRLHWRRVFHAGCEVQWSTVRGA